MYISLLLHTIKQTRLCSRANYTPNTSTLTKKLQAITTLHPNSTPPRSKTARLAPKAASALHLPAASNRRSPRGDRYRRAILAKNGDQPRKHRGRLKNPRARLPHPRGRARRCHNKQSSRRRAVAPFVRAAGRAGPAAVSPGDARGRVAPRAPTSRGSPQVRLPRANSCFFALRKARVAQPGPSPVCKHTRAANKARAPRARSGGSDVDGRGRKGETARGPPIVRGSLRDGLECAARRPARSPLPAGGQLLRRGFLRFRSVRGEPPDREDTRRERSLFFRSKCASAREEAPHDVRPTSPA